jgi:NAD(P)H-hydrate repair Nnr-like enzyme with NAD(P)H-hydrate epimerase domain
VCVVLHIAHNEARQAMVKTRGTTTATQMPHAGSACAERLARFFPDTQPVQVRAVLTPLRSGTGKLREPVLLEFASAGKVIFSSELPLEFDDRVRLTDTAGGNGCDATVVAVQYHDGHKAVALQFAGGQGWWVKRP